MNPAIRPLPPFRWLRQPQNLCSTRHQKIRVTAASLGLVAVIGAIGYFLEHNPTLILLYLVPVRLATWRGSLSIGLTVALVAVATSLLCDGVFGTTAPDLPAFFWHGLLRIAIFGSGVFLLSGLRNQRLGLTKNIPDSASPLRHELEIRKQVETEAAEALQAQRESLADQLHDGLGQTLTGIALKCGYLAAELENISPTHAELATKISALLGEAVGQTRRMARGLSAMEIDADEVVGALENLALECRDLHRIDCLVESHCPQLYVGSEQGIQLYLITQQAIDNAVRHGNASQISIRIERHASGLQLLIIDNGRGFTPTEAPFPGLGLRLMRFRAGLLGGTLQISSDVGLGTRIECLAPALLRPPPAPAELRVNELAGLRTEAASQPADFKTPAFSSTS